MKISYWKTSWKFLQILLSFIEFNVSNPDRSADVETKFHFSIHETHYSRCNLSAQIRKRIYRFALHDVFDVPQKNSADVSQDSVVVINLPSPADPSTRMSFV
jgi:hypothetical protein